MKITKYILISLCIILVLYFIIINFISAYSNQLVLNNSNNNSGSLGADIKLNVGDSVGVSIIRNRWYGKIYEEGNAKTLYLFNIIKTPIEAKGRSYILTHLIFTFLWFMILISTIVFEFALRIKTKNSNVYIQENIV